MRQRNCEGGKRWASERGSCCLCPADHAGSYLGSRRSISSRIRCHSSRIWRDCFINSPVDRSTRRNRLISRFVEATSSRVSSMCTDGYGSVLRSRRNGSMTLNAAALFWFHARQLVAQAVSVPDMAPKDLLELPEQRRWRASRGLSSIDPRSRASTPPRSSSARWGVESRQKAVSVEFGKVQQVLLRKEKARRCAHARSRGGSEP